MFIAASVAAAAAVVAAATVSVLPGHSGGGHPSGSQAAGGGGAGSNVGINLTAAVVLRNAGKAAGEQQGGWPNAAYWSVTSVYKRDGKTFHRDIWISHRRRAPAPRLDWSESSARVDALAAKYVQ